MATAVITRNTPLWLSYDGVWTGPFKDKTCARFRPRELFAGKKVTAKDPEFPTTISFKAGIVTSEYGMPDGTVYTVSEPLPEFLMHQPNSLQLDETRPRSDHEVIKWVSRCGCEHGGSGHGDSWMKSCPKHKKS